MSEFIAPTSERYPAERLQDLGRDERAKALQWLLDNGWKFSGLDDAYISPEEKHRQELAGDGILPL